MPALTHRIALSDEEIDVIEAALQTQEKILSLQARAGGAASDTRLASLRRVLRRLRRRTPRLAAAANRGWGRFTRAFFC